MNDLEIKKLGPGDKEALKELLDLYLKVFGEPEPPKNTDYLPSLLQKSSVAFAAAILENKVIGGLTAHFLPSIYGDYSEVYLYDLAVAEKYQRHGVGTKLLTFLEDFAKANGAHEVFVQADTPDTEARNFYRKNGGIEEDVRHYGFPVKS